MRNFSAAIAFLFALLLTTLLLTACGEEETGGPDEPNSPETPAVAQPNPDGTCPNGMVLKQDGPERQCLQANVSAQPNPDKQPDPDVDAAAPEPEGDATAPPPDPPDVDTCADYMNDPEWSWVGQANGRRYMCGRAECTFEPLDGPDGCEAKCQPAFYRLVEELEHLDHLNFQYTDTGGGTWTCNAM